MGMKEELASKYVERTDIVGEECGGVNASIAAFMAGWETKKQLDASGLRTLDMEYDSPNKSIRLLVKGVIKLTGECLLNDWDNTKGQMNVDELLSSLQ